ncbi:MAG TPA: undecaprenyl-phosphate glucose phosphotransferase, partial [Candidatus Acidoferrales bacterium]|nr:undecaprenyl-phosphate glucose phosphotransferase [Candidatus Acidoferrales bacterium]
GGEPPDLSRYAAAAPVAALCVVSVFATMGVYRRRRGVEFIDELFSVLGAMAVTGLVVFALIGLKPGNFPYSRLTFVYWLAAATVVISLARYGLRRLEARRRARGLGTDSALVVGSGAAADLLIQRIRMFPDYGYRLVGVVADGLHKGSEFGGVTVVGATSDLANLVRGRPVDVVFLALPEAAPDRVLQLVETVRDAGKDVRIVPSMLELMTTRVTADQLDGIPLLQYRRGLDLDGTNAALKRAFDMAVAATGLVVLSPLLAAVALLVRLTSPGPVLLHQERVGKGERSFRMHKFRSMRADAEEGSGPVWAAAGDTRRTPLGRVLRRLSLDELPQLWNILVGDMSLVGPRPERPVFVQEFGGRLGHYGERHRVQPGLSGWAQVNDLRGSTPVEERLIYDLYYIENWSLAFDLKIILITLFRVFTSKNAY